jgi:hypothetical protein
VLACSKDQGAYYKKVNFMMADNQLFVDRGDDDDIFVYTGEQRVPRGVKRVRIAENVTPSQHGHSKIVKS